ncbi:MAG: hypothetical protein IKO41_16070 [Lachnospiraceae bacterium]|nr:hypothetical protein [Lachnospiraceae bacterium]
MTVRELIKILTEFHPDAVVQVGSHDHEFNYTYAVGKIKYLCSSESEHKPENADYVAIMPE